MHAWSDLQADRGLCNETEIRKQNHQIINATHHMHTNNEAHARTYRRHISSHQVREPNKIQRN